ncbi:DUF4276 family protein [Chachezhania antarctica]|uniref:DUF4276 family protein n=1 Tax=Chachezhania antarctica TaxID=2340860 RepID=UPI000EB15CD3|nr:DUF4276 family protein [Chachezhania antarctica]|tara:strand:- start:2319 stop:2963 length:645 start_codon:yes stop_codon:yes gene_type:complete
MYLSWAAYYEGSSDEKYFNVLIPRLIDNILLNDGVRPYDVALTPSVTFGIPVRDFDTAADQICARREEFHILIVHADSGGRNLQKNIAFRREALVEKAVEKCGFEPSTTAFLTPIKELEAWAIADFEAVLAAFGAKSDPEGILPTTPKEAEALLDPKATLRDFSRSFSKRKNSDAGIMVRIAQEQNIEVLRNAASFLEFEESLKLALEHVGCIK